MTRPATLPILVFLHGVGDGDPENRWKATLSGSLQEVGYSAFDGVTVVAPKYAHALKGWDEKVPMPPVSVKQPGGDAARQKRREFERRIGALEFRLGRHDRGDGLPGADAAVGMAIGLPSFKQARNYLEVAQIRAQVLEHVLTRLPKTGRIVIVGHSLGSVVAADLIRRLPPELTVVGMITIGSPLAHAGFGFDTLRDVLREPPANLGWWVNFWNVPDLVAAHRGVSSLFPWMLDFRINTRSPISAKAHSADEYLGNGAVAEAIGFALFGSRSKELAKVDVDLDIPLDAAETLGLLALRYAHLVKLQLKADQGERFAGALRSVQASVVGELMSRNRSIGRPNPSAVARLAFDLSNPDEVVPESTALPHLSKADAVVALTILASQNVIRPFEIAIHPDKLRQAMRDLAAEFGLTSQYGTDVFAALEKARDTLTNKRVNWFKWVALGAGAAAIVVATGGLALAAGAGLAGAAVLTSALASFGPGGMIGGLLTAGTLVTAGGGGIAVGLASPSTTAESLELVVEQFLAVEILRQKQMLDSDPRVWSTLVRTEMELRREYERLDEFSDASAPGLQELARKIDSIERALQFLREHGLEPTVFDEESESEC